MQKFRLIDSDVLEEGADGRQTRIPAPSSVSARFLDISQEDAYQLCIDIRDFQMPSAISSVALPRISREDETCLDSS